MDSTSATLYQYQTTLTLLYWYYTVEHVDSIPGCMHRTPSPSIPEYALALMDRQITFPFQPSRAAGIHAGLEINLLFLNKHQWYFGHKGHALAEKAGARTDFS